MDHADPWALQRYACGPATRRRPMSTQKIVRDERRVHARAAEYGLLTTPAFESARRAILPRPCGPAATAFDTDLSTIEERLPTHRFGQVFGAVMLELLQAERARQNVMPCLREWHRVPLRRLAHRSRLSTSYHDLDRPR